jgi:hypothetical protein
MQGETWVRLGYEANIHDEAVEILLELSGEVLMALNQIEVVCENKANA